MTATANDFAVYCDSSGSFGLFDVQVVVKLSLAGFGAWRARGDTLANRSPLVLKLEPPASWCKADAA
jgi:hypothetical protein